MKAILEFNLPEDKDAHNLALNGAKYYFVIEEVLQFIRQKTKYGELPKEQEDLLEQLRNLITDEMQD